MRGRPGCDGFTLFEVLLAVAIVGLGMAVITQVVWTGMDSAQATRDSVQAELLAESVMSELLSGIRPMESAEETTFDEESGLDEPDHWLYSIDVAPLDIEELFEIAVTTRINSDAAAATSYTLTRWIFVPEEEETEE